MVDRASTTNHRSPTMAAKGNVFAALPCYKPIPSATQFCGDYFQDTSVNKTHLKCAMKHFKCISSIGHPDSTARPYVIFHTIFTAFPHEIAIYRGNFNLFGTTLSEPTQL
jgi:hypothetical protein